MTTHPPSEKSLGKNRELAPAPIERVPTNGDYYGLPTHVQLSDSENVGPKPGGSSTATAVWERFNGYGRKRVGFFESVKAVVLSSCTFTSIALGC